MTDATKAPPILEFLRARLAEDQAAAERLAEDQRSWSWLPDPEHPDYRGEVREIFLEACNTTAPGYIQFEAGEHIARHDPARVLREIAAKRALLDWVPEDVQYPFASIYSDHPDYQQEWGGASTEGAVHPSEFTGYVVLTSPDGVEMSDRVNVTCYTDGSYVKIKGAPITLIPKKFGVTKATIFLDAVGSVEIGRHWKDIRVDETFTVS